MKTKVLNVKLLIINFCMSMLFYINIINCFGAEYLYKNVAYLHDYLIISDFWGVVKKGLGNWFFDITSWLLDGCYDAYASMSKFDILENAVVKDLLNHLDKLVYSVFFVVLIIVIVCKMLKIENPLKIIGNVFTCLVVVLLFSSLLSLGSNLKDATINDIDSLINNGEYRISSTIYANNTVDVLKSLKRNEIVNLSANDIDYFDRDEVVRKAYLIDKPRIDETTGEVVYEDLSDGLLGVGEVRYYRYNTDFWTVNCTIIASIIVYILAMLKHTFLLIDWFLINIFGKFALGRGFFDINNLANVGKSIVNNLVSQVILYAMMSLFSVYMSTVMVSSEIHWIFKALLIWGYGMIVFVGSSFINRGLGVEDNFGKVAGAILATQRLSRTAKKRASQVGNLLHDGKEKISQEIEKATDKLHDKNSQEYQDEMGKEIQSDEFKEALQERKSEDDIRQAKEQLHEKDYQDDFKEQAKKELYGDDPKLQEEKDKLFSTKENKKLNEQSKIELYEDEHKLQEEKDKLIPKDEQSQVMDQAKKELYDDKYQEVKQDVIDSEKHTDLVDKAKVELHGEDYKEKQKTIQEQMIDEISQENMSGLKVEKEISNDEFSDLLDKLKKGEL